MWVGIEGGTEQSTLDIEGRTIHSSRFHQNRAVSCKGRAYGGGVFQTVSLTLLHTELIANTATITEVGLQASAGALYAGAGAQTELLGCVLQSNNAGGQ